MRKISLFVFAFFVSSGINEVFAQQLPEYTQYPSLLFQINPAYSGTKSNIDARLDYRKQWTGFDGQPTTQYAAISSRLLKGRIGVAGSLYKDVTGPTTRNDYTINAAYHLHLADVEFCAGIGMNFNKYTIDGTKMTTHWTGDPAVDYSITDFHKNRNGQAGLMLYNDRFHFGLSIVNMASTKAEFYLADTTKKSIVAFAQHYYFTCGYNFNANPDFVWENNLMATYVTGCPMTINYNLRVHYKEKITAGVGWRLKDALYLQAGYIFLERIQLIYTYDVGISNLRKGHSGSHEIMLGYRMNINDMSKGYKGFNNFQKQKYHIF
jgi:type IX secretion system PorP/SprF family membrane protein